MRLRDVLHSLEHVPGALASTHSVVGLHATLRILPEPSRACWTLLSGVLARQPAPGQWAPRQQAQSVVLTSRHDLELDPAHEQAVRRLKGDRDGKVLVFSEVDGLLHLPAGEVRQPGIADLARAYRVVEEAQRLLQRGARIPRVQLVEVDVFDA